MWAKILGNVITLGIPAIIRAVAKARRAKREQKARLAKGQSVMVDGKEYSSCSGKH